jgi:hypothetical protein
MTGETIKQKHGVGGARMIATVSTNTQSVLVTDDYENREVIVALTANSYPAGLTTEQARMISRFLVESADRIDAFAKSEG